MTSRRKFIHETVAIGIAAEIFAPVSRATEHTAACLPEDIAHRVDVDLLTHVETALDHPVEKVWPFILHWKLWIDDYIEYRVAGSSDDEGEIKSIAHLDETGRMDSVYFVKVIKIVPCKQLVYKILSPSFNYDAVTGMSTEVPLTGYDVFTLRREKGQTIVSIDIFAEMLSAGITGNQGQSASSIGRATTEDRWRDKYFPTLKELLSGK